MKNSSKRLYGEETEVKTEEDFRNKIKEEIADNLDIRLTKNLPSTHAIRWWKKPIWNFRKLF